MKRLILFNTLCVFLTTLCAQVQFVSAVNSRSGTFSLKVASIKSDGTSALLHDFTIADPTDCNGVISAPGGKLYGTTASGGNYANGTLFSVNADGSNFTVIHHYKTAGTAVPPSLGPDGKVYLVISDSLYTLAAAGPSLIFLGKVGPSCRRIVIGDDHWVYGCGQQNNAGLLFRIKTDGSGYSVLHTFNMATEGFLDVGNAMICLTPTGRLFLTSSGGYNEGYLVSMRTDGSDFKVNKKFTSADQAAYGSSPLTGGAVTLDKGKIIFTMFAGGEYGNGAILSFDTLTSGLTRLFSFPSVLGVRTNNATHPQVVNGKLVGISSSGLYSVGLDGTGYQQLNTRPPAGYLGLTYDAATSSIIYTTTGGAFKNTQLLTIDAATNAETTIHSFGHVPEGYNPAGLIRAPNGVLYGIARSGGSEGGGTLFRMDADGSGFAVVKDFTGRNGQSPVGQLLYGSDGRLYGVCERSGFSGASDSMLIYGVDVDGNNYSVLHLFETKFDGNLIPELAESPSGMLAGLVSPADHFPPPAKLFTVKKDGSDFTIVKTFSAAGADGFWPRHGLVFYNGYFYGVNAEGGSGGARGLIYRIREDGSDYTIVKYFTSSSADGANPEGGLMLGSDNKLYGATANGGVNQIGTVFSLNPADLTFSVIRHLQFSDGFVSLGKITEASDGRLYLVREKGILSMNRDGSAAELIASPDYIFPPNTAGPSYVTEIPLPDTVELCAPSASTQLTSDVQGVNYQWQVNTGSGFGNLAVNATYSGTHTRVLKLSDVPSLWTGYRYRCLVGNGVSNTYTIKFANSWTGAVNNSWENPANWSCGVLPDSNTDVAITGGVVVINSNVSIRSLTLNAGGVVSVNAGFVLSITH